MTADKVKRDVVLEKIRKCFALSKSANEHEAAAALRQAQKLMLLIDASAEEVGMMEFLSVLCPTRYSYSRKHVLPVQLVSISTLLEHALGVKAYFEGKRTGPRTLVHAIRYFGPRTRIHIAEHAHYVVLRAVEAAWWKHVEQHPEHSKRKGARAGFYAGWCQSVRAKVKALVWTGDETQGVEQAVAAQYTKVGEPGKAGGIVKEAAWAGMEAAESFQLHTPIG